MALGFTSFQSPPPPPGPPPRTQTDPSHDAHAYRQLQAGESLAYASQTPGLTPAQDVRLSQGVRVLDANQQFFDHWKALAESQPAVSRVHPQLVMMGVPNPPEHYAHTQIESDRVAVLAPSDRNLVRQSGDRLSGDPQVLSAFETSQRVDDAAHGFLGRQVPYRSEDQRLRIYLDSPSEGEAAYRPGTGAIGISKGLSGADPDLVAHEQGHAMMDAIRPGIRSRDTKTIATGEAFADSVAVINSLDHPDVRADALKSWERGRGSSLASNIAEGTHAGYAGLSGQPKPPSREGIRDVSTTASAAALKNDDGHEASRQFSSGVYRSIRDLTTDIRARNPEMSADDALRQARQSVGSDLHRAMEFMPNSNATSQNDLAEAMMKAGRLDRSGSSQDIYRKNFQASGLTVSGDGPGLKDAELARLNENPALALPGSLRTGQDYELRYTPWVESGKVDKQGLPIMKGGEPIQSDASREMQAYLNANREALGLPKGLAVQRITHNDRGETNVLAHQAPDINGMPAPAVGQGVVLNFDSQGHIEHLDLRTRENRPQHMPFPQPQGQPGGAFAGY